MHIISILININIDQSTTSKPLLTNSKKHPPYKKLLVKVSLTKNRDKMIECQNFQFVMLEMNILFNNLQKLKN